MTKVQPPIETNKINRYVIAFYSFQIFTIFALSILHEQTTAKASNKLVG